MSDPTRTEPPSSATPSSAPVRMSDLLRPEGVVLDLRAKSKDLLLREVARIAAPMAGVGADAVARALLAREALGSTGMGHGFALPHARIEGLPALFGMFVRLARPLDFAAVDGAPVDLLFPLLIPAPAGQEHVSALAAVSRQFRDPGIVERLRRAEDAGAAYRLLAGE